MSLEDIEVEDQEVEQGDEELDQDSATLPDAEAEADTPEDDEEEVIVTIGEQAPPDEDEDLDQPGLVNKLRKLVREKEREARELRAKVAAPAVNQQPEVTRIAKPTLADCDYDEDAFESKLTAWHEQQAKVKAEEAEKAAKLKAEQEAWQATLKAHASAKQALKVLDYDEAEAKATEIFSQTQQGIIVTGAKNSAVVMYALGKNPAKAKELAAISNPVKFAFAVADLEKELKVTPRKAPPVPEKTVRGSAPIISNDANLARLEAAAEKTGDRSKVIAYKKALKAKQAA